MRYPFKVFSSRGGKQIAACADLIDAARVVIWHSCGVIKSDGRIVWDQEKNSHLVAPLGDIAARISAICRYAYRKREENRIDSNKRWDAKVAAANERWKRIQEKKDGSTGTL